MKDENDFKIVRKVSADDKLYRETIEEENVSINPTLDGGGHIVPPPLAFYAPEPLILIWEVSDFGTIHIL